MKKVSREIRMKLNTHQLRSQDDSEINHGCTYIIKCPRETMSIWIWRGSFWNSSMVCNLYTTWNSRSRYTLLLVLVQSPFLSHFPKNHSPNGLNVVLSNVLTNKSGLSSAHWLKFQCPEPSHQNQLLHVIFIHSFAELIQKCLKFVLFGRVFTQMDLRSLSLVDRK